MLKRRVRWGRWLCRAAIVGWLLAAAFSVVLTIREFGDGYESLALVGVLGTVWAIRLMYFHGLLLQGHSDPAVIRAAGLGRNLVTLPIWLLVGYYLPLLEQIGWWSVKLLPLATFHALDAGLPQWLALTGVVIAAPIEVIFVAVLFTLVVLTPAKAIFGERHPVVESLQGAFPHVTVEGGLGEGEEGPS